MMSRFFCNFLLLTLFLVLVTVAISLQKTALKRAQRLPMKVGEAQIQVETAKTALQIEKGLGGRDALQSDGMLFYMPNKAKPLFWMKGMQFALDFIWIDGGKVVDLTEHVQMPAPNTTDAQLVTITPKADVTHVLEVADGFVKQHNIKIGDAVVLP